VITLDNPPVNGMGQAVRKMVYDGIAAAQDDPAVKAIVPHRGGQGVFRRRGHPRVRHGEDVLRAQPGECRQGDRGLREARDRCDPGCRHGWGRRDPALLPLPVAKPDAKIALPEVKIGLLPGCGGTQRLPRLIGLEPALNIIVSGEPVSSQTLAGTFFDRMIEGDLLEGALEFAREVADKRPLPRVRDRRVEHENPEGFLQFARNTVGAIAKNFPAPLACIEAIAGSVKLPFDEGLRKEREGFVTLMNTRSRGRSATRSSPSAPRPRSRTFPRTRPRGRSGRPRSSAPAPWAAASR
jgi:3-hydroxyacyl-CoA dehydrogenase